MNASSTVLATTGLVAGYDGIAVVHGVDLEVRSGEVVALLGANGAGKSTTLLTISGLLATIGGRIEVLGRTLEPRRRARPADVVAIARSGVAHVPEDRGLFYDLTAEENLRLGVPARRHRGDVVPLDTLTEWFPMLEGVLDRQAGLLSGGEQQMVTLARALRSRPKLLMVDEMSLGLAPIIVEQLLPVLRTVASELGCGVLVVEQHVSLVLAVSDRAYLLDRGRVVLEGPASEVAAHSEAIEAGYFGDDPGS